MAFYHLCCELKDVRQAFAATMGLKIFSFSLIYAFSLMLLIELRIAIVDASTYKTVVTRNGAVRGILKKTIFRQKPYFQFMGIPFAEPPIGELRFKVIFPHKNYYS